MIRTSRHSDSGWTYSLNTHTHLIPVQTDTVRKLVRGWSSIPRE